MVRDGYRCDREKKEENLKNNKQQADFKQNQVETLETTITTDPTIAKATLKNKARGLLQQLLRSIKKLEWLIQYGIGNKRNRSMEEKRESSNRHTHIQFIDCILL